MIRTQEDYEVIYEIVREIIAYEEVKEIDLLRAFLLEMENASLEELQKIKEEMEGEYNFRVHNENGLEYHDDDILLIIYKLKLIEYLIEKRIKSTRTVEIQNPTPKPVIIHEGGITEPKPTMPISSEIKAQNPTPKPVIIHEGGITEPKPTMPMSSEIKAQNPTPKPIIIYEEGITEPSPTMSTQSEIDIPEEVRHDEEIEQETEEKTIAVRVVKRYKTKWSVILASIAASLALAMLPVTLKKAELVTRVENNSETLSYIVQTPDTEEITETAVEKAIAKEIDGIIMGGQVMAEDGDTFYTNSQELIPPGGTKTMGNEFTAEGKTEGEYRVTGFSIIKDGEIVDYIEDFDGTMTGPKLGDYVREVCNKNGIDVNDVQIKIHLGNNTDITRLGWIDVTALITADDIPEEEIEKTVTKGVTFGGRIDNFKGEEITLLNGVTVKIKNGEALLKEGDIVIGDDGQEYTIIKLESIETSKEPEIDYEVSSPNLALAVVPLIVPIVSEIRRKKRNDEAEKNPELFEFEDQEEYARFKEEFENAEEETDANYQSQEYTKEQIKKIFEIIEETTPNIIEYIENTYQKVIGEFNIDNVRFEGGRIIYVLDNESYDITEVVLTHIASIGKDNQVASEGELTDEIRKKY